jgi:preprotein translocase subunit SecD
MKNIIYYLVAALLILATGISSCTSSVSKDKLTTKITLQTEKPYDESDRDKAIEVLRTRLDKMAYPYDIYSNNGELIVDIEGDVDKDSVIRILTERGGIELRKIQSIIPESSDQYNRTTVVDTNNLSEEEQTTYRQKEIIVGFQKDGLSTKLLLSPALMYGEIFDSLEAIKDKDGTWIVNFLLMQQYHAQFEEITGNLVDSQVAFLLDGEIISVPMITEKITNGRGELGGGFSENRAKEIVIILESGPLPVGFRSNAQIE